MTHLDKPPANRRGSVGVSGYGRAEGRRLAQHPWLRI